MTWKPYGENSTDDQAQLHLWLRCGMAVGTTLDEVHEVFSRSTVINRARLYSDLRALVRQGKVERLPDGRYRAVREG